jgi:perosamine synthetase
MDEILAIANKHNLVVLEDAAEGLGSEYKGKKCGSIGHAGVFSFHGTKTMSTGEGGILVTNDRKVFENASILNDHGRNPNDPEHKMFWMRNYGYKYKMSNLQAAMGCAQVERLDELVKRKREVFNWYKDELKDVEGIQLNQEQDYTKNSYWMPTIILGSQLAINRDELIEHFAEQNIDGRPFFHPLTSLPMFPEKKINVIARKLGQRGINLPSHHELKKEDVKRVINVLLKFLKLK